MPHNTERLVHLKWVLVDQILDLATATEAIREHLEKMESSSALNKEWTICYLRMCTTFLIVSLAKLWEAFDHYSPEIGQFPADLRNECNELKKEIGERRKIYQFRSKYAAHIIDKQTKKPISSSEGERRYKDIVGETVEDIVKFCDWINPATEQPSVISTVTKARNHCLSIVGRCHARP